MPAVFHARQNSDSDLAIVHDDDYKLFLGAQTSPGRTTDDLIGVHTETDGIRYSDPHPIVPLSGVLIHAPYV